MTTENLLFQIIDVSSDDVPMGGEGKEFKVTKSLKNKFEIKVDG